MKRTFAIILVGLVAAGLFGGLVHAVLVAAHVSEPAATTVQGLTPQKTLGHHGRCASSDRRPHRWEIRAKKQEKRAI
jgi:hypothetical protein